MPATVGRPAAFVKRRAAQDSIGTGAGRRPALSV
jgi:hypothetical protein